MIHKNRTKIALVNMPFASLYMPSLALTQMAHLLEEQYGDRVDVSVHYLSFDFVDFMGDLGLYNHAHLGEGFITGIGEWFFRQAAFPDAEDNAEHYFDRFYFADDPETRRIREAFTEKRAELNGFLDELIERYNLAQCSIVGFTTLFSQTVASFALAQRLKEQDPGITTVVGGAACDGIMGMEFAKLVPQVDYIFSGPSLITFPRFVGHCMDGDRAACDALNGVFSKTNRARWPQSGEPTALPEQAPLQLLGDDQDINRNIPLDYVPFLDDMERTLPPEGQRPVLLFETSRGCWWAEKAVCSFCGLNGLQMKHRHMHPDQALKHIQSLFPYVERCPNYMAVDTILPKGYTSDVFPRLNPPEDMKMFYELKVDISEAEIKTLSESGVVAFQPGIESLNTNTLKLMRKGTSAFRNIMFLKNCGKYTVSLDWNLLIYSPGEPESTFEKYQQDLPHLMHLAPPSGVYPISFARFSRYFDDPEAFELDLAPQDFYALTYPFAAESVFNVAYHFTDRGADTERINFWLDQLNATVARWRERWTGGDGQSHARLCFMEKEPVVYDSRGGMEKEHAIGEAGRRVLEFLNKPGELVHVEKEFKGERGVNPEQVVADLLDRGLLFNESGRMLNLVMDV